MDRPPTSFTRTKKKRPHRHMAVANLADDRRGDFQDAGQGGVIANP
jgi:hypothetical protein